MTTVERQYRRLLLAYPKAYREERGDEIVDTVMEANPGPSVSSREAWSLVTGGFRTRAFQQCGTTIKGSVIGGLRFWLMFSLINGLGAYLGYGAQGLYFLSIGDNAPWTLTEVAYFIAYQPLPILAAAVALVLALRGRWLLAMVAAFIVSFPLAVFSMSQYVVVARDVAQGDYGLTSSVDSSSTSWNAYQTVVIMVTLLLIEIALWVFVLRNNRTSYRHSLKWLLVVIPFALYYAATSIIPFAFGTPWGPYGWQYREWALGLQLVALLVAFFVGRVDPRVGIAICIWVLFRITSGANRLVGFDAVNEFTIVESPVAILIAVLAVVLALIIPIYSARRFAKMDL